VNEIGLVIVNIPEMHSKRMLKQMAQRAIDRVPPGRTLAFVFRMSPSWKVSSPVEGVLTDVVLGRAGHRPTKSDWEFAGNLAVRVCKPAPSTRQAEVCYKRGRTSSNDGIPPSSIHTRRCQQCLASQVRKFSHASQAALGCALGVA
jgi:hypothetical protein